MTSLAIIYHSGYGHTAQVAKSVQKGANLEDLTVDLISVDDIEDVASLTKYDGFIFGTPTYMGDVSAAFKGFMEKTSGIWFNRELKDKIAAGFTCSGSLAGDKGNTLASLVTFANQHGMLWVSQGLLNNSDADDKASGDAACLNRAGFYTGLAVQADNAPAEEPLASGDLKTAEAFGQRVAQATIRWNK